MNVYLIDIENVNLELFLKSRKFTKDDKFCLVGNSNLKFNINVLKFFEDKEYKVYFFNDANKNYADKILFTILGSIIEKENLKNAKFYMVSNDNIFSELKYTENLFNTKVENIKFDNSQSTALTKIKDDKKEENIEKFDIENLCFNHQKEILSLRYSYDDLGEFHNELVKKFGMEIGKKIYKFMKENNKL